MGISSTVYQEATRQRLIAVLMSSVTQQIDFYLGYLHVNGAGYQAVADALNDGFIGIRFGQVQPGAAAQFSSADKVFDFPEGGVYGLSVSDAGLMVHEATHAMKWLVYSRGGITEADTQDEAAAYVAGWLYMLYNGHGQDWDGTGAVHYVIAGQIARSIMNRKGALVSADEEARLRAAVTLHPVYRAMNITYYSRVYQPRN